MLAYTDATLTGAHHVFFTVANQGIVELVSLAGWLANS